MRQSKVSHMYENVYRAPCGAHTCNPRIQAGKQEEERFKVILCCVCEFKVSHGYMGLCSKVKINKMRGLSG